MSISHFKIQTLGDEGFSCLNKIPIIDGQKFDSVTELFEHLNDSRNDYVLVYNDLSHQSHIYPKSSILRITVTEYEES